MRRRVLAVAGIAATALVAAGCPGGIEEQVIVSVSSPRGAIHEGRTTLFSAQIVDRTRTESEIAAGTTWSISGETDDGFPVAELVPAATALERTVRGLHPGLTNVAVSYRGRTASTPLAVAAVSVVSIQVPSTITVAVSGQQSVIPVFRDSVDVSLHRHDAVWTVQNPATAEVLRVQGSEPAEWRIRGKAVGTTNVTVTSGQASATIEVAVQ